MSPSTHQQTYRQLIRKLITYALTGRLRIKNGHLPKANHKVPDDFIGVCVTSSKDEKTDAYILKRLKTLKPLNVRLDFSYEDLGNFNERFLKKLIAAKYQVTLRLIPPFESAKNMLVKAQQTKWQSFLATIFNQYGAALHQVEIGNTINRKRWAGFTLASFLKTWAIARRLVKTHHIKLLGPNVQDFEPMYNIGILEILQKRGQLPDVHTNNLFVERISEPERFDHRIFKFQWSNIFKYNLIKKARILQSIGQNFGVTHTSSSAAFWAIYRIERRLINGLEKQADYLTRYFTLLAASGAIKQANWGTLICHREGLINDGLTDRTYPPLERITHYKNVDGHLKDYQEYPSFYAMKTAIKYLNGAHYKKALASAEGLEMHVFEKRQQQIHIVWTVNGKLAILNQLYDKNCLNQANILHRDGNPLKKNQGLVTETPTYLIWDKAIKVKTAKNPSLASDMIINKHIANLQYFHYQHDGWQGLILAKNKNEVTRLLTKISPSLLQNSDKQRTLRHARNVIWTIANPCNNKKKLTIKQPIKMYPHKTFLDRFKPSKAKRSWNGAMELLRRDIDSPQPIAYFEKIGDTTLKQNLYLCEYQSADFTIGQVFPAFAAGKSSFHNITPSVFYPQFARFCSLMHKRGIYFRDFSGGNILVNIQANDSLHFSLIDTARLRTYHYSVPMRLRLADLTRACNKLHWAGREQFMRQYLALDGKPFTRREKIPFYIYDFKVKLKRIIGRKGIKQLIARIKRIH